MQSQVNDFLSSHAYSAATKSTYAYVVTQLLNNPIQEWGAGDLLQFVEKKSWGKSMRYVALCACKSFIRWKYDAEHPALSAKIKRPKPKPQRTLKIDQLIQLLALFDTYTPIGARDQCLIALAADTGLRVAELASIKIANIDTTERTIIAEIKGGQWSYAVYSPETGAILDRWLSYRKPAEKVNHLFITCRKGKKAGTPLSITGIKTMFKRWSKKLDFKISPHDIRRGFAVISTMHGAPSRIIQVAGRWSNIDMVERYTRAIEAQAIQPYLPMHNIPVNRV
jgi:integrase